MKHSNNIQYAHTFAVTVTYDDRYRLLQHVVSGAFANGVEKIIIVDNGSALASKESIQKLELASNGRVTVVVLPNNRGSAAGFKAGVEYAQACSDCEFLWLLDDDNHPTEGALAELLTQHHKLSQSVASNKLALVSLRKDWEEHKKVAQGVPVHKAFPRRSSFMGFHFLTPPRIWSRFFPPNRVLPKEATPIEIPFAPYGGLFFHKSAVAKLGYPNERFFLYNDDTEYTYRFSQDGGKLFLVPSSVVCDLEPSWHVLDKGETLFSHLLNANSDLRIYYATRNQSYLARHFWMGSLITYTFNKWAFFLLLGLFALKHGKWKRVALIARAVRQGEVGELGCLKI
ncbi:MAG TPA: glycosyltransferase [Methylomirabilota bacterium]|nr:glycosyltransferase [Methylomirabilota bacterium]